MVFQVQLWLGFSTLAWFATCRHGFRPPGPGLSSLECSQHIFYFIPGPWILTFSIYYWSFSKHKFHTVSSLNFKPMVCSYVYRKVRFHHMELLLVLLTNRSKSRVETQFCIDFILVLSTETILPNDSATLCLGKVYTSPIVDCPTIAIWISLIIFVSIPTQIT